MRRKKIFLALVGVEGQGREEGRTKLNRKLLPDEAHLPFLPSRRRTHLVPSTFFFFSLLPPLTSSNLPLLTPPKTMASSPVSLDILVLIKAEIDPTLLGPHLLLSNLFHPVRDFVSGLCYTSARIADRDASARALSQEGEPERDEKEGRTSTESS